jgi:hypothetical protein
MISIAHVSGDLRIDRSPLDSQQANQGDIIWENALGSIFQYCFLILFWVTLRNDDVSREAADGRGLWDQTQAVALTHTELFA